MVKNLPPMQGHRFNPWSRKIAYASGLLRPCTTSTEAQTSRAHVPQQKKPPQQEAHAPQLERSPCSSHLEKARAQQWRPSAAKHKYFVKDLLYIQTPGLFPNSLSSEYLMVSMNLSWFPNNPSARLHIRGKKLSFLVHDKTKWTTKSYMVCLYLSVYEGVCVSM